MFESVLKLPRCDDAHKIHAWLSDRFGSHRAPQSSKSQPVLNETKYLFAARSAGDDSLLSVFHNKPIPQIAGSAVASIPEAGSVVKFRARFNPTKRAGSRGRIPVSEVDLHAWFQRQMNAGEIQSQINQQAPVINDAAEILSLDVVYSGYERLEHGSAAMGVQAFNLWSVEIEGVLKVIDRDLLRERLLEGVGRYKGHGYGMVALEGMSAYRVLGL